MTRPRRPARDDGADGAADDRLAEAVARCRERMERGEAVDVAKIVRGRGRAASELRKRVDAMLLLDGAFGRARADEAAAPLPVGAALGPYRLRRVVGSGGMGTVYLATAERKSPAGRRGTRVAVKVVHPHLLARRGYRERFLREAEIGRRVQHPNVVRTFDAGETRSGRARHAWLAMEFVEGRTLAALMRSHGPLPEPLCRQVGREVAAALEAIHAAGAVHRDVKPENVIVSRRAATANDLVAERPAAPPPENEGNVIVSPGPRDAEVVKLMDLGVARPLFDAATLSETGAFVGSVLYAAPEQFASRARDVDARTDLHGVGLLLHEMATGVQPFAADGPGEVVRRILSERPARVGDVVPALSPFFEELVATLLAKDPAERLASAAELRGVLERGESSEFWIRRAAAARRTSHRLIRRRRPDGEPRCVGRTADLDRLRRAFARAAAGDGNVVLVTGEAGIGKSRLADELAELLASDRTDFDVLFAEHAPFSDRDALVEALRARLVGAADDDLRDLVPAMPPLVAAFGALLRGTAAPAGAQSLTPDSLTTLVVQAIRGLAARRPALVWVDDLHFAPAESRSKFTALARAVAGHRVLLVGTTRPEAGGSLAADLSRSGNLTRIDLSRLGVKDLVLLLTDALGSKTLAEELAGRVGLKSDGNPYFALEIVRSLQEEGRLARRPDGKWGTTQSISEIKVPSSVQDLVAMRLHELGRSDRDLVDAASCAGFRFDPTLVGDALGLPRIHALQRFSAIEAECGIVRSDGRDYSFDHHQAQEVVLAAVNERLREEIHAALGAALEARHGAAEGDVARLDGELCVELTRHFVAGGQGLRARRYFEGALDRLERTMRYDAHGRLLRSLRAVPGLVEGAARCRMLLRNPNGLGHELGQAERRAMLEEAVAVADAAGDGTLRSNSRNVLGLHFEKHSQFAEAETAFVAALDLARACGDRVRQTQAMANIGLVMHRTQRSEEAMRMLERARTEAEAIGRRDFEGSCAGNIGMVLNSMGRHEEARAQFEKHLAVAREIGDLRFEVAATGNLGISALGLGFLADAIAQNRRCLEIARAIGYRVSEAIALENLSGSLFALGQIEEAEETSERCLVLTREIGAPWIMALSLGGLGAMAAERGDDAAAQARYVEALATDASHGGASGEISFCRWGLAEIAERAGRLDDARARFEEVFSAGAHPMPGDRVIALAGLARLGARDPQEAARALAESAGSMGAVERLAAHLRIWKACGDTEHLRQAKRLLDHLLEHAPPASRAAMLSRVRNYRETAEAARALA